MREPDIVFERVKARAEQYEIERQKRSNHRQIAIAVIAFAAIIGLSIFLYRKLGKGVTTQEPVSPTESVSIENSVTPTESANLTEKVTPTDIVKPTDRVTPTTIVTPTEVLTPPEKIEYAPTSKFVCDEFVGRGFLTEDYALYHANQLRLQMFDVASGTDIVFCFDPSCTHDSPQASVSGQVIKPGCVAYDFSPETVMISGEYCYFLTDTGEVWRSDLQGQNRKMIGAIPAYIVPSVVFFSEDSLFVTYANAFELIEVKDEKGNSRWTFGDTKDTRTCGLLRVNLADGELTEIFQREEYNAGILNYDIRGDHLYFLYYRLDIPYIGPDLETNGPTTEIPEGLTTENYWEEMPKHMWVDIFDYNLATGELQTVLSNQQPDTVCFCNGFFAMSNKGGTTGLYRYNGSKFRELPFVMTKGVRSDDHLVCVGDIPGEYMLIDEETGEVLKRTTIPNNRFVPNVIIGKSCYGTATDDDGNQGAGYLSANDFWDGNMANVVKFNVK